MKSLWKMLAVGAITLTAVAPMMAQDATQEAAAPEGVFYGTWPYILPPEHHFNAYTTNGPLENLGNIYRADVELPPAIYNWGEGVYYPLLAESWGFTEDNSAYEITLRDDALWSNGDPVTSEDVIVTYALGRANNWSQWNYISDIEVVDDHTVRFVFSGEPSLVAERLFLKENIVSRATYGELAARAQEFFATEGYADTPEYTAFTEELSSFRPEEIIASGPYLYTLDDVGDAFMTLRWQPNSIFSDSVNFGEIRLWGGETEATTPLVLSGELGHSTNVYPASTIEQFQAQGLRLLEIPRGYGPALLIQHDVAPFNNVLVRKAMAHAINREQSAFLTNGIGATPTEYMAGLLDPQVPQLLNQDVIDQLDRYAYDLEGAAAYMEEAGFTRNDAGQWVDADGNTISAEYTFPAEFADFAGAAQDAIQQLNDFGFDIQPRALPWQEAAAAIREGNFELSVWSWGQASPFAARQFFGPLQRFNYVGLTNDQIGMNFPMEFEYNGEQIDLDELITRSSDGLDEAVQRERAGEVALIINDLLPFIPLNVQESVEPINEDLIAGVPTEDSWLQNPTGSDHALIWYLLTGVISPGPNAMGE